MIESINWNTLTPEQRDVLIAEKVFKRKVLHETAWNRPLIDHGQGLTGEIPHYSTDLNAAWTIVIQLKGVVLDASYKHDMLLCRATFVTLDSEYHAYGPMPEAICIAALRTSGFEVVL